MLRYLADYSAWFGPLRVFDSITFRAFLGTGLAFALCLLLGGAFIRRMRRAGTSEDVNKPDSDTLHRLHAGKTGTPTMGGLFIITSLVLAALLACDPFAAPLVEPGDLLRPERIVDVLHGDADQSVLAGRVRASLTEDGRAFVATLADAQQITGEDLSRLARHLNAVLLNPDLAERENLPGLSLPPRERELQAIPRNERLERHVQTINRAVLQALFPYELRPMRLLNPFVVIGLGVIVAYALLGFGDDYVKLRGWGKQGLTKRQKLAGQFVFAILAAWGISLHVDPAYTTRLLVPFTKWETFRPDLGWFYYVFFVLVIVSCSNAVNLTDGLDGLAAGCTVMVGLTYVVLAYVVGNAVIADYFRIPFVPGAGELAILSAVLIGSVLGFLWFNAHPAQVFMGDTGSLALGAGIAYIALVTKHELVLFVAGGVFVLEATSVMLQVASFRSTGRRIFKCAPYHHHLEFSGWHENHVVVRLWIAGALLAGAALATLKMH